MMNHHDHHRGLAFLAVLTVLSLASLEHCARAESPAAAGDPAAAKLAIYSEKIRPLLAEQCFSCHGGLKQEAGLRLDTVALMVEGGESGAAIVKGDPDKSLLFERVSDPDPASRMPPATVIVKLLTGTLPALETSTI